MQLYLQNMRVYNYIVNGISIPLNVISKFDNIGKRSDTI